MSEQEKNVENRANEVPETFPCGPLISCIIVFLNEENNLRAACQEALRMETLVRGARVEVIFVDDGSTDRSWEVVQELVAGDPRCRALRFTRNFGAIPAVMAGMAEAKGDWLIDMSADGQDPVEMFADLVKLNLTMGYDVSWGCRRSRKDGSSAMLFSKLYYVLMRRWVLDTFPRTGLDAFCCSRKVASYLINHYNPTSNLHMLMFWANFKSGTLSYDRRERIHGRSKWSMSKKIYLFINTFVSFTYLPLRLVTIMGILWLIAGGSWTVYLVLYTLITGTKVAGFPTLMSVLLLGMGSVLFSLGVISEYIWRALEMLKRMPLFVVQDKIGERPDAHA